MEDIVRADIFVYGHVQGVFFRASTLERAQSLRLFGWVENLPDGAVEILVEGPRYEVLSLIDWAKRGPHPHLAVVEDVTVRYEKPRGEFETFVIRD